MINFSLGTVLQSDANEGTAEMLLSLSLKSEMVIFYFLFKEEMVSCFVGLSVSRVAPKERRDNGIEPIITLSSAYFIRRLTPSLAQEIRVHEKSSRSNLYIGTIPNCTE